MGLGPHAWELAFRSVCAGGCSESDPADRSWRCGRRSREVRRAELSLTLVEKPSLTPCMRTSAGPGGAGWGKRGHSGGGSCRHRSSRVRPWATSTAGGGGVPCRLCSTRGKPEPLPTAHPLSGRPGERGLFEALTRMSGGRGRLPAQRHPVFQQRQGPAVLRSWASQEAESDVHLVPDVVSHFTALSSASRQALRAGHSRGPRGRAAPLTQQPLDTSRALQQALRGREQAEWEADTSGPPAETCLQDPSPGEALATSLAPPSGCS